MGIQDAQSDTRLSSHKRLAEMWYNKHMTMHGPYWPKFTEEIWAWAKDQSNTTELSKSPTWSKYQATDTLIGWLDCSDVGRGLGSSVHPDAKVLTLFPPMTQWGTLREK